MLMIVMNRFIMDGWFSIFMVLPLILGGAIMELWAILLACEL